MYATAPSLSARRLWLRFQCDKCHHFSRLCVCAFLVMFWPSLFRSFDHIFFTIYSHHRTHSILGWRYQRIHVWAHTICVKILCFVSYWTKSTRKFSIQLG